MDSGLVLVTGGSGFVGAHCLLRLIRHGYRVRTTLRSPSREAGMREMLTRGGVTPGDALGVYIADLTSDEGWAEAAVGCDNVLHVASPFPLIQPKHANDLIVPARDGTLRVLRAARDTGVKRVVVTSSFAAIGHGRPHADLPFSEQDWTDLDDPDLLIPEGAYTRSKTIAEHAAWDFIAREGDGLELSVVNPVGILGPVLGPDISTSVHLVSALMKGAPFVPRLYFNVVDVRDVADLHVRAMNDPMAKGERFIAAAGDPVSFMHVAEVLRSRMGHAARHVPTRELPDWMAHTAAPLVPALRQIVPELGVRRRVTNEKARRVLGWDPRPSDEAIVATAQSLVETGVVRP